MRRLRSRARDRGAGPDPGGRRRSRHAPRHGAHPAAALRRRVGRRRGAGARPPRARRRLPGRAGRHPPRRRRRLQPVRGDAASEPGHRRHPHHRLDHAARREALPFARGRRLLLPVQAVRAARAARAGRSLRAAAARAARQGGVRRDAGRGPGARAPVPEEPAAEGTRRGRRLSRASAASSPATRSAATSGSVWSSATAAWWWRSPTWSATASARRCTPACCARRSRRRAGSIPIRRGCRRRWSKGSTSSSRRATPRSSTASSRASGRLRYWSAGHPPALLRRAGGGCARLGSTGPPLSRRVPRAPARGRGDRGSSRGDRLLVYSDGRARRATRARPSSASRDSSTRSTRRRSDLGGALDGLRRLVFDHVAGRPLEDDVTMVLVERESVRERWTTLALAAGRASVR